MGNADMMKIIRMMRVIITMVKTTRKMTQKKFVHAMYETDCETGPSSLCVSS